MFAISLTIPLWALLPCGVLIITLIGHLFGAQCFESRNNYLGSWAFIFALLLCGLCYGLYAGSAVASALFAALAAAWFFYCLLGSC